MGRYRTPAKPKTAIITAAGYALLQQENKTLWVRRNDVVQHLSAAAAEGDRSENAEYIYRKKQLREIDRRIRYLQKRLPELQVVSDKPATMDQVFFGATATLRDSHGDLVSYRIVGPDEHDLEPRNISIDSPMARALLRCRVDDEIRVRTPEGIVKYVLVDIEYE